MRDRSMRSATELTREIKLTDWSTAGNLSNRSSGVQIPCYICTRLKRYLYSAKCSWIIIYNILLILSMGFFRTNLQYRLQNSRFLKAGSAVSVILECEAREPHTPCWGEKTTVGFPYNEFVLRRGCIMLLRWRKLLDSSIHILNLILWMSYFSVKFAVSRFSGDLERTSVFVLL